MKHRPLDTYKERTYQKVLKNIKNLTPTRKCNHIGPFTHLRTIGITATTYTTKKNWVPKATFRRYKICWEKNLKKKKKKKEEEEEEMYK